jgi:hypothetical protein
VPVDMSRDYEAAGHRADDDVVLIVAPDAGHFEPIAPGTPAWGLVRDAVTELISRD